MSRNKYPEETVQKILDVSFQLFQSKGYDKTSIQDIVDKLGMSKGAIYHHFKSKEEILDRLCSVYEDMSWFEELRSDASLNGLQKLEKIFYLQLDDERKVAMDAVTGPVVYNSRLVLESMRSSVNEVAPLLTEILEEGVRDGSIHTQHPREAAEVLILLINVWINPSLFPVDKERFLDKILYYQQLLDKMGIPLMDGDLTEVAVRYYNAMTAASPDET